jgi:hypothetical protein
LRFAASLAISVTVEKSMSRTSARVRRFFGVEAETPVSLLLTACRLTPSCSARASWLRPARLRHCFSSLNRGNVVYSYH